MDSTLFPLKFDVEGEYPIVTQVLIITRKMTNIIICHLVLSEITNSNFSFILMNT